MRGGARIKPFGFRNCSDDKKRTKELTKELESSGKQNPSEAVCALCSLLLPFQYSTISHSDAYEQRRKVFLSFYYYYNISILFIILLLLYFYFIYYYFFFLLSTQLALCFVLAWGGGKLNTVGILFFWYDTVGLLRFLLYILFFKSKAPIFSLNFY